VYKTHLFPRKTSWSSKICR